MFEQLSPVVGGLYTSYGGKSTLICGMLMDMGPMGYANNKTWSWVWSFQMLESCSSWWEIWQLMPLHVLSNPRFDCQESFRLRRSLVSQECYRQPNGAQWGPMKARETPCTVPIQGTLEAVYIRSSVRARRSVFGGFLKSCYSASFRGLTIEPPKLATKNDRDTHGIISTFERFYKNHFTQWIDTTFPSARAPAGHRNAAKVDRRTTAAWKPRRAQYLPISPLCCLIGGGTIQVATYHRLKGTPWLIHQS